MKRPRPGMGSRVIVVIANKVSTLLSDDENEGHARVLARSAATRSIPDATREKI